MAAAEQQVLTDFSPVQKKSYTREEKPNVIMLGHFSISCTHSRDSRQINDDHGCYAQYFILAVKKLLSIRLLLSYKYLFFCNKPQSYGIYT